MSVNIDRTQRQKSTHEEPHVKRFHIERLDQASGGGDSERGLLHRSSRADTARHIHERPPATASRSSRRSSRAPKVRSAPTARGSRTPSPRARTRSRRCSSITCDGCSSTSVRTSTSCTRVFSIPISTSTTEDAVQLFKATGVDTIFEKLEGFPADWKTNAPAFIKFVREHQCPSFLEYGEYPYVSAAEIKKALALKQAFSSMLDHMQ